MIPLLVLIAWPMGKDLTLFFVRSLPILGSVREADKQANFETITLFVSVMLVNLLLQDGKSNYMEGLMCTSFFSLLSMTGADRVVMSLYLVIALSYFVS